MMINRHSSHMENGFRVSYFSAVCFVCLFLLFFQLNLSLKGRLEAEREMTKRQYKYYYGERCQIYNSQSLCGVLCGWGGG